MPIRSLAGILEKFNIKSEFCLIAPETDENGICSYVLFIEPGLQSVKNPGCLTDVSDALDHGLKSNYHYEYCRKLGQLGPCRLFVIDAGEGNLAYHRVFLSRGQKAGDIKPSVLSRDTGWSREFRGKFW